MTEPDRERPTVAEALAMLRRQRSLVTQDCVDAAHFWDAEATASGDTCNCGDWYRFADRIERTPDHD